MSPAEFTAGENGAPRSPADYFARLYDLAEAGARVPGLEVEVARLRARVAELESRAPRRPAPDASALSRRPEVHP